MSLLCQVASDPAFSEFLAVHQSGPRAVWTDDVQPPAATAATTGRQTEPGSDSGSDSDSEQEQGQTGERGEQKTGEMSDMEVSVQLSIGRHVRSHGKWKGERSLVKILRRRCAPGCSQ